MMDHGAEQHKKNGYPLVICACSYLLCFLLLAYGTYLWMSEGAFPVSVLPEQDILRASFEVSDRLTEAGDLDRSSSLYRDLRQNPDGAIFSQAEQNWQPGDTGVKYLRVGNAGSLPFDYLITFSVEDRGLGEVLSFTITKLTEGGDGSSGKANHISMGTLLPQVTLSRNDLPSGDAFDLYRIAYHFSESAGNHCKGSFCMDVTLRAQTTKT